MQRIERQAGFQGAVVRGAQPVIRRAQPFAGPRRGPFGLPESSPVCGIGSVERGEGLSCLGLRGAGRGDLHAQRFPVRRE